MFNRSYIYLHKNHPHYLTDAKLFLLQKRSHISPKERRNLKIARELSDPTKYRIYQILQRVDEVVVSDLTLILKLPQSTISHALSDLKKKGLIFAHRCGQLICYSLKFKSKEKICD